MVHRRASRLLAIVAMGGALACASAPPARPRASSVPPAPVTAEPAAPAAAETGGLSFSVEPADAEVFIDGRSYGKVADLARSGTLPLQAGLYQVSLKCPGYSTWRAEVAVRAGVEPIRVTLTRRSSSP